MADGIPYPQGPSYEMPNPLQEMSQMSAIAQRNQAMQQQALVNRAQLGMGQLMQQHIDPATGDLDINKFLVDAAQHPDVAVMFPAIAKDALANKLTTAQILGAQIENATKQQSFLSNIAASYADKASKTGKKLDFSDIASIYAEAAAAGVIDRKEALQGILIAKQAGVPPNVMVERLGQRSAQGLSMLENAGRTTKYLQEFVSTVGPEGEPMQITREQALGLAQQEPSGGPSAPRPDQMAREGEQPSVPPPVKGLRTGLSPIEQATSAPYRQYQEGSGPMREYEQTVNNQAETARVVLERLQETEKVINKFKSGPLTKSRFELAKIASGLGFDNLAERLVGGDLSAAQEFEKLTTRNAFEELKTALGGQGRFTNLEVENFTRSNFNLETMPEAIQDMMNFTKKMVDLSQQKQLAFDYYKKSSFQNKTDPDSFNPGYFDLRFMNHLRNTGQIKNNAYVVKQPGEK